MNYYKAYETNNRPFLLFDLVADSMEELIAIGLDADPLVVPEDRLTDPGHPDYISYEYGICHYRIFNGLLELRPAQEITDQQTALSIASEVQKTFAVSSVLDEATFTFDGKEFPLTPSARAVYTAVIDLQPPTRSLITTTGNYTLTAANISMFKTAYYNALFAAQDAKLVI